MNRRRDGHHEGGFTLIELLVVIIVIGLLAAIATPLFLQQRRKGYDTDARADLRNLANFEEIYLVDFDSYGTIDEIRTHEPLIAPSAGVTLSVVRYQGAVGYCLSAVHQDSGHVWYWDSQAGGQLDRTATGCPVTTTGVAGDSLAG